MKVLIYANPYFACSFGDLFNDSDSNIVELQTSNGFEYDLSNLTPAAGDQYFLIGNADFNNQSRTNIFASLLKIGVKPEYLASKSANISHDAKIGMGSLVHSGASLDGKVTVGFNTIIAQNAILSLGVKVGNNCFIGPNTCLEPGVVVGNNVYIHGNCRIAKDVKIDRDVVINDSYVVIRESVKTGMILDSDIGDFVRILR